MNYVIASQYPIPFYIVQTNDKNDGSFALNLNSNVLYLSKMEPFSYFW